MKTEIAASKFLHRLAAGGVIVNKLCVVITLIVAYSSPSWASENAQSKHDRRHFTTTARQWTWQTRKRGFLSGGSSILTGRLATTRRRHTPTGVTEDYRILALTT